MQISPTHGWTLKAPYLASIRFLKSESEFTILYEILLHEMFRTHNCILIQLHHLFYATFYNPRRGQILSCGKLRNQMPDGTRPETFAQPIALQVDIMTFKCTITFLNNCRQHKQNSVIHCSATQNHCHKIPSMINILIPKIARSWRAKADCSLTRV